MATRCNDKVTRYAELIGMSLHTSKLNYKLSRIQVIFSEPALYRPSPVGKPLVNILSDINTRGMLLALKHLRFCCVFFQDLVRHVGHTPTSDALANIQLDQVIQYLHQRNATSLEPNSDLSCMGSNSTELEGVLTSDTLTGISPLSLGVLSSLSCHGNCTSHDSRSRTGASPSVSPT